VPCLSSTKATKITSKAMGSRQRARHVGGRVFPGVISHSEITGEATSASSIALQMLGAGVMTYSPRMWSCASCLSRVLCVLFLLYPAVSLGQIYNYIGAGPMTFDSGLSWCPTTPIGPVTGTYDAIKGTGTFSAPSTFDTGPIGYTQVYATQFFIDSQGTVYSWGVVARPPFPDNQYTIVTSDSGDTYQVGTAIIFCSYSNKTPGIWTKGWATNNLGGSSPPRTATPSSPVNPSTPSYLNSTGCGAYCGKPLHRGEGRGLGLGVVMRRQILALLGIEHGVALHEGDFALGLLALVIGLGAGDAVGINDQLAGLALADMAAEFDRLPEGEPQRAGIALGDGGRPLAYNFEQIVW
jgi:hypothetical protein